MDSLSSLRIVIFVSDDVSLLTNLIISKTKYTFQTGDPSKAETYSTGEITVLILVLIFKL